MRTGEGAGCPLLKNPIPTVDHSVKDVNESLPALLEKSGNVMSCGLESGHTAPDHNIAWMWPNDLCWSCGLIDISTAVDLWDIYCIMSLGHG